MNGESGFRGLSGKVVVVTGGARGIGRAIALAFAREGARVAVADTLVAEGRGVARLIRERGGSSAAWRTDVSRKADVDRLLERALARFGQLDILVNNAGIAREAPALEIDENAWDTVLAINLKGAFLCMQAAARHWVQSGSTGTIVNISSIGAERVGGQNVHYAASKGGLKALSRGMAVELAPHGIRVNVVGPGSIPTSIMGRDWADSNLVDSINARIPIGRMGRPDEVAEAVLFLASENASYITGQSLYVEGGRISKL